MVRAPLHHAAVRQNRPGHRSVQRRQAQAEGGALRTRRHELDVAAMGVHDVARDHQPQAGAAGLDGAGERRS